MAGKIDKTEFVIAALIAVLALFVVIILMNIVDRSSEHVTEISKTDVKGPGNNFSAALNSDGELESFEIRDKDSAHPSCYVVGQTLNNEDISRLVSIKNLRELWLKRCDLKGAELGRLAHLPLQAVHVTETEFDSQALINLAKIKTLRYLEFYDCSFPKHGFLNLAGLSAFWLHVRNCVSSSPTREFTHEDITELAALPNLRHLEMERSYFQPRALCALQNSKIVQLNCKHCRLDDAAAICLSKIRSMAYMNIADNPSLTCRGFKTLLSTSHIEQIKSDKDFTDCKFSLSDMRRVDSNQYQPPESLRQKFEKD